MCYSYAMLRFTIEQKIPGALGRAGTIETPHGKIQTPAFIPVGTKATIKSLTPEQVASLGADAILANTYHLYLQPGTEVLKKAGGLGAFMNWHGPTFTDSGGFQAFSLGSAFGKGGISKVTSEPGVVDNEDNSTIRLAKADDDGVTFKSVIDGSTHRFTPEKSIHIQHDIAADIIFAFDECLSPQESYERQKAAVARTYEWAKRCLVAHQEIRDSRLDIRGTSPVPISSIEYLISDTQSPALFGIIQGGRHEDLRREAARTIGAMGFDGFGIGGSFDKNDIGTAVGWVCQELPENKPRHLLGIGEPEDLILGIENGIDTFDCVAPTRIARNGAAYVKKVTSHPPPPKLRRTRKSSVFAKATTDKQVKRSEPDADRSRINLFNAQFAFDFTPIQEGCGCYTCTHYTRAYIAHLFRAKEMLAATLTSIHNLYFLVHLVKEARQAIVDGRWEEFKQKRG